MKFDVTSIKQSGGNGILSKNIKHVLIDGLEYDKTLGVPLVSNGIPIGYIYKVYNEIKDGETYISPRN